MGLVINYGEGGLHNKAGRANLVLPLNNKGGGGSVQNKF